MSRGLRFLAQIPGTLFKGQHYGYGVVLAERFGKTLYYHGGGVKGFETVLQRYPKERVSIVVLENLDPTRQWDIGSNSSGTIQRETGGVE